jgi:hypothetical protein
VLPERDLLSVRYLRGGGSRAPWRSDLLPILLWQASGHRFALAKNSGQFPKCER